MREDVSINRTLITLMVAFSGILIICLMLSIIFKTHFLFSILLLIFFVSFFLLLDLFFFYLKQKKEDTQKNTRDSSSYPTFKYCVLGVILWIITTFFYFSYPIFDESMFKTPQDVIGLIYCIFLLSLVFLFVGITIWAVVQIYRS